MTKTTIKLPDGTTIEINGSTEEIQKILSLYIDKEKIKTAEMTEGTETDSERGTASPKIKAALAWTKKQTGKYVQPCKTPNCKYNYGQLNTTICEKPNPRADDDDVKTENHSDYHPFWNFYCMRFVRTAYGAPADYPKAESMYQALNRDGLIRTTDNIPEGALVFWHWSSYGHIGIYVGDEKKGVVHTGVNPQRKTVGIRVSPLDEITDVLNDYNHYESAGTRTSYLGWAHPPKKWLL